MIFLSRREASQGTRHPDHNSGHSGCCWCLVVNESLEVTVMDVTNVDVHVDVDDDDDDDEEEEEDSMIA